MSAQHAYGVHPCGAEGHLLAGDSHLQTRAATSLRDEGHADTPLEAPRAASPAAAAALPSPLALEPAILPNHAEEQQQQQQEQDYRQHLAAPPQLHAHSSTTSHTTRTGSAAAVLTHVPAEPALPLAKCPTGVSYMASTEDSISHMLGLGSTHGPSDGQPRRTSYFRIYCTRGLSMRCFHLAWLGFFWATFSTFAPAALLPAIQVRCAKRWGVGRRMRKHRQLGTRRFVHLLTRNVVL